MVSFLIYFNKNINIGTTINVKIVVKVVTIVAYS